MERTGQGVGLHAAIKQGDQVLVLPGVDLLQVARPLALHPGAADTFRIGANHQHHPRCVQRVINGSLIVLAC